MQGYALPQRNLVSQMDAATIEDAQVPRSTFVNQWTRKAAYNAGRIYPMFCREVLPGDHWNINVTAYIRMATPLFPIFDQQRIDTHFFFVPNRLVWDNWVKFMGEQNAPGDSIAYNIPRVTITEPEMIPNGIFDHFGLPQQGQLTPSSGFILVNALPFRMYNLIYNQWFRDENLSQPAVVNKGDTGDVPSDFGTKVRAKSHDYFTSALPWPQKQNATVQLPINGVAPVTGIGKGSDSFLLSSQAVRETSGLTTYPFASGPIDATAVDSRWYIKGDASIGFPQIYADLSNATGVTINQLRQAWMVQSLLERDARGGTRYTELLRSHFRVINPDFRLQRPEYIGGGQSNLNITPIAQTAPTTGVPLGAIGGAGTAAGTHRASYAATEHGYIIGVISVKTELSYQQGLERHWGRFTRYDFYWPALAGLGEQAVLNREIYCIGDASTDFQTFGYQERWQEYRTHQSEVVGVMRSTATGTLDAWHFAQKFTTRPNLNDAFISEDPPMFRVLAAGSNANNQEYLADIMYQTTATRPIPTYGTPATLGRF